MEIKNAIIEKPHSTLMTTGFFRRGCIWTMVAGGFGGYVLYLAKTYAHHRLLSTCGHFVFRCLKSLAPKMGRPKGKTIRGEADHSGVRRIGHIVREDWFCPADDFGRARQMNRQQRRAEKFGKPATGGHAPLTRRAVCACWKGTSIR